MCKIKDDFVVRFPYRPPVGLFVVSTLFAICGIASTGCDRTSELAESKPQRAGHLVAADAGAAQLLERSAAAYARLSSYSDTARVVLTYKVDGKTTQDVAPLAVAFERPNRLGLRAYQVTAGVTDTRFRMRLTSEQTSPLRSQVVSRALPKQIDTNWLLLDNVAAQHLAAGLAGAPPQLDWLLSDQPFQALVDSTSVVTLDGEGSESSKTFHIVKIMRGEAKFRLWIDAQTSLLRRIELPTVALPTAMLADQRISDIHLSIEFDDVRFNDKVNWSEWQVPIVALDQLVRYFVAPPALALDPRLGKAVPAFRMEAAHGTQSIDTSAHAAAGQIQMLVWLADHPSCRTTADQITQALAQLPETIRSQVSPVIVWAEPQPAEGTTFATLAEKWNITMPVVLDRDALGRDLLGVAEAPTIVILDRQHRLQFFQERAHPQLAQALPQMLTRLVDGESLANTMNAKAQVEQDRYVAQLWLARASDSAEGAFTRPKPYAPQLLRLAEQTREASEPSIMALTSDALHNLWILKHNGELECHNSQGQTQTTFQTDWASAWSNAASKTDSIRLVIDDKANYVALVTPALPELQILDTKSRKTSKIDLGGVQSVADLRWLSTPQGDRLAAITRSGRTVLIDPSRQAQMSGQSPARPVALLERSEKDSLVSGYVILIDGRIEPVILEDQAGAKQAVRASSVSTKAAGPAATPVVQRQLKFTPAGGPWTTWQEGETSATLARGMLADDEPAVFLLDQHLGQQWHAPLPISEAPDALMTSVARDPVSGQPLWIVVQPRQTVHFFRADGALVDHCQLAEPVRGVALVPSGNELHLWLAHPQSLVHYRIE